MKRNTVAIIVNLLGNSAEGGTMRHDFATLSVVVVVAIVL